MYYRTIIKQEVQMYSIMLKSLVFITLSSFLFPLGGLGFSGMGDFGNTSYSEIRNSLTLDAESSGMGYGINLFLYIDALPNDFAIEYNRELSIQPTVITIQDFGGSFDEFGNIFSYRDSEFFTLRKKIFGAKIPFLAEAGIYLWAGFNQHSHTPKYTISVIEQFITADDDETLIEALEERVLIGGDLSNIYHDHLMAMQEYRDDGYHIQAGIQGRIFMASLFINIRYTLIDGVYADSPGFTSTWCGLAFSF